MKKKIAVTPTSFGKYDKSPLTLLEERGFKIKLNPYGRKLGREEFFELSNDAVGIIAGTEQIDASVLESLPKLKVISRCGTGMDNIDMNTAKRLGIEIYNTPDASTLAVAELTVGLILNLLRKIHKMDSEMRHGKWEKHMGNLLFGKKIGIIGFGRIGKKVAELLMPFGCKIRYYDIRTEDGGLRTEPKERTQPLETKTQSSSLSPQSSSLDELFKECDIVSIHVSSNKQIIGEGEIKLIKNGACLINVSRGGVVDENALYNALKENHLAGAALDVFEDEPYTGHLIELDNVILTPHIGSYAKESRIEMERQAVKNLLKRLEGDQ